MDRDLAMMLGVIGTIVAGIIAGAVFASYMGNYNACQTVKELTGVQTNVSLSMGCLVKYRGEWVDVQVMTDKKQDVTVK